MLAILLYILHVMVGFTKRFSLKERKKGRMLRVINHHRKKRGLGNVKAYYYLDKVAKGHSWYMAKHNTCNHAGFSNRAARIRSRMGAGYIGENVYKFPGSSYNKHMAYKLVEGWLKSPGHRANLLNPKYKRTGIGIVVSKGYVYATQIFTN